VKIVYAADNRYGSALLLSRFIEIVKPLPVDLRVAAYRRSTGDFSVDWTLDALTNNFIEKKDNQSLTFNGNFEFLKREIERYEPDLIISDLEIYTSLIALDTRIELWQASPTLLYFALPKQTKMSLGLSTKAKYVLYSDQRRKAAMEKVIDGASKRLIVSHIGDVCDIEIDSAFEFVRPEILFSDRKARHSVKCEIEASDAFYNDQPFDILDEPNDLENMILQAFSDKKTITINQQIQSLDTHIKARL
jgi:hypothetical protein